MAHRWWQWGTDMGPGQVFLKNAPRPKVQQNIPPPPPRSVRRRATGREVDSWLDAASKREPPRPRDRNTLREYLKARNPRRWAQLQRHLKWAEQEMLQLGLNPEDTRWIL